MFGIIRPCRHRLGGELGAAWQAHLCGMCLSLRDDHGPAARLAGRGPAARRPRWRRAGRRRARGPGRELGFDVGVLTEAVARQTAIEATAGPGTALLAITEPTETATAAAFAYTAVLACLPANEAALSEAGRLFGRIAHLADAVEDLAADRASGTWNPLLATGTDPAEARLLCDDALLGIRLALADAEFTDTRLLHALLVRELTRSVHRVFASPAGPVSGLSGLAALRQGRGCGASRCCGCGEDCCVDCACDGCCEGCCDGCCDSCDCTC